MRKEQKNRKRIAVFLLMVVLVIAGCSTKDETSEDMDISAGADSTTATENAAGGGTATGTDTATGTEETAGADSTTATENAAGGGAATGTDTAAGTEDAAGMDITSGADSTAGMVAGSNSGAKDGFQGSEFFDIEEIQAALDSGSVTIDELAQRVGMPADQLEAYLNMAASMPEEMSALAGMYGTGNEQPADVGELMLPASSAEFSMQLASQALTLCTGHNKDGQAAVLTANGFEIILQNNYDKAYSDISHTCAYTVGRKKVNYNGSERTLLFIAIRGTNGGEWFSNFNFAESHSEDTEYAENFMYAAQSVSVELVPVLLANPDALVMISGHSRGAAAANLLGMLLNETRGAENVFCYTFATPNTYRGSEPKEGCENIFNIINPCDVVTKMPLTGLGFGHVGTDIILPGDPEEITRLDNSMNTLYEAAPSVKAYYEERHSLTGPGLAEDGMTAYEIMLAMASAMTGITDSENGGVTIQQLYKVLEENPGSAESDFAPLFEILQRVIGADGSYGMTVFGQHMPATYQQLMNVLDIS